LKIGYRKPPIKRSVSSRKPDRTRDILISNELWDEIKEKWNG